MPQVIVGLFNSYRDGDEALRALQAQGLARDHGHLYQAGRRDAVSTVQAILRKPFSAAELDDRIDRLLP